MKFRSKKCAKLYVRRTTMDREDLRLALRQSLLDIYGEDFCYNIFSNPRDVNNKQYKRLFSDYEWFKEPMHETTLDDLS